MGHRISRDDKLLNWKVGSKEKVSIDQPIYITPTKEETEQVRENSKASSKSIIRLEVIGGQSSTNSAMHIPSDAMEFLKQMQLESESRMQQEFQRQIEDKDQKWETRLEEKDQ